MKSLFLPLLFNHDHTKKHFVGRTLVATLWKHQPLIACNWWQWSPINVVAYQHYRCYRGVSWGKPGNQLVVEVFSPNANSHVPKLSVTGFFNVKFTTAKIVYCIYTKRDTFLFDFYMWTIYSPKRFRSTASMSIYIYLRLLSIGFGLAAEASYNRGRCRSGVIDMENSWTKAGWIKIEEIERISQWWLAFASF